MFKELIRKIKRPKRLLTVHEVALISNFKRTSIRAAAKNGEVKARKIMGEWRFTIDEIADWLRLEPDVIIDMLSDDDEPT